jgi:serine/threonine protein kinase
MMIGRDDKVKIGDLGLARRQTNPVSPNTVGLGSPFYMAPEQISNGKWNSELKTSADAFALGVMMVEAVACTHNDVPSRRQDDHGLNKTEMEMLKKYMRTTRGKQAGSGLLEIAEELCRVQPAERLTPKELKKRLLQWKAENPIHPAVASR